MFRKTFPRVLNCVLVQISFGTLAAFELGPCFPESLVFPGKMPSESSAFQSSNQPEIKQQKKEIVDDSSFTHLQQTMMQKIKVENYLGEAKQTFATVLAILMTKLCKLLNLVLYLLIYKYKF
jgi:hypothetical protein